MIKCQLVVAMAAEARPIIDHFRLKQVPGCVYRTYSNDQLSLVESGIGKLNAAGATAETLTRTTINDHGHIPVCINIGIAGSDRPVGEMVAAHLFSDVASGKRWYPQLTWNPPVQTASVVTVDTPSTNYEPSVAFDMEASGFVSVASKYTTMEFVQSLKIISDNPARTVDALVNSAPVKNSDKGRDLFDHAAISDLVAGQLPDIEKSINQLIALEAELPDSVALNELMYKIRNQYHVSASQGVVIRQLLQSTLALTGELPDFDQVQNSHTLAELKMVLQTALDASTPVF